MDKLKLEIIKKVLMLDTMEEVRNIRENVSDAITKECDLEDKEQEEFKKWKANQVNV
tara:strand:- start:212 stop:382 length:171 start_codon:yes stop_codon:yes gene_type:complete